MNATLAGALTVALVLARGQPRSPRATRRAVNGCSTSSARPAIRWTRAAHNLVGPNLHGLFGRKAGSADYQYSDAMKKSGIVWDETTLAEYLKDPKGKVPGTKMTYIGLRQEQQQQDMIAFLEKATQ